MDGIIAKKIFMRFLKERKYIGIASMYFTYGIPYFKDIETNLEILNRNAKHADNTKNHAFIKGYLINMLGEARSVKLMIDVKRDILYNIYLEWGHYIENNWEKIYNEFYNEHNKNKDCSQMEEK